MVAALKNMAVADTNVMAAALTFKIGGAVAITNMAMAITNSGDHKRHGGGAHI